MKLGELGEVSFGILKLGELGEVSFGKYKLGELDKVSFGILKTTVHNDAKTYLNFINTNLSLDKQLTMK